MAKILGLDLGTNSIGWAIRDTDEDGNQFFITNENGDKEIVSGVVVFKKGVGEGKSGEYSLAAERRSNRSKRRLYNAKRYRKWATLKILLENGMCPLTKEELRLWSIGNWVEIDGIKKNTGRVYPTSPDFIAWLSMDERYFGNNGLINTNRNDEASYLRKSPYDLRCELLENHQADDELRLFKVGRAFYHLVQRRGFKTSRKSGKSAYGENEYLELALQENSELYASQILNRGLNNENRRIRNSGVIQRKYFEKEFAAICEKQRLTEKQKENIYKAIYYVRSLKSQKGLVGKCTLEKGKPRIPVSHPAYEEFRALQYINNIQWRETGKTGSKKDFKPIEIELKKKILEGLYFKRKKSGLVDDRGYFEFKEIVDKFSDNHKYEFNYAKYKNKEFELLSNPNVSTCPVIAGLMNVFEAEWTDRFIEDENRFGINWDNLILKYEVKYEDIIEPKELDFIAVWHLLFDYIQTKDQEENLKEFCKDVIHWDAEKTDRFTDISISQGYGSLSYSAIHKIIPFLQDGYIYSEAVLFANLNSVLGKGKFEEKKEEIKKNITSTIKQINKQKELLNITNGLIQQFFADNPVPRAKGINGTVEEITHYAQETLNKLKNYFGESSWNDKNAEEKEIYESFVLDKYLRFLDGKQEKDEKASGGQHKIPNIDYYKLPRLDEAIKQILITKYEATEAGLKKLYHPSDINIYPKSITGELEDPNPPSNGWKNPMAMRTMYELRTLVNYLLETNQIDEETRIVVEMARENNDTNYRKAYTDWITDRDKENQQYAKGIVEMLGDVSIANISDDDYNKFRSAVEQITELEFSANQGGVFFQKYKEFIKRYLTKNRKGDEISEDDDGDEQLNEYLMYLILCRDEFAKYLNFKLPNSTKWQRQILITSSDYTKKRKELQDMLVKYRLWKQQNLICYYTGNPIPFTKLFSDKYQIEHTIPRSISFDSELKNLTVCDADYNNNVKNNKFPTQCPNYYSTAKVQTNGGQRDCTPIEERVNKYIKPKVVELKSRINNLQKISKRIPDWEKGKKDANIQLRHYLKFELEYWEKKLLTFTVKKDEWKDGWKNSQLIDTQIITKYARAYLKTVFNKVDVQKGSITAEFRKIYRVMGDEKKDRSKHTHHVVDAAVLTLIPGSAKREDILKKAYKYFEKTKVQYHDEPYENFSASHIQAIENHILINHVSKDQTLSKTRKNVRKRGRIQYLKTKLTKEFILDGNGNKIPLKMQGDNIRGQLHLESYFGAIKPNERNEEGFVIKKDGKYVLREKNGEDEIWIVIRKSIENVNLEKDILIDEVLKNHIAGQLKKGTKQNELIDFNGRKIRHIRCRVKAGVGFLSKEKALPIKEHIFKSKFKHKQNYLVQNAENYLYLIFEGKDKNGKTIRGYKILNLLDVAQLKVENIEDLKKEKEYNILVKRKGTSVVELQLKAILKVGDRVILYKDDREEISDSNVKNRLYKIYKLNEVTPTGYLYCQHHLEAGTNDELGDGDTLFNAEKYQPRLKLGADNFNCLVEKIDFNIEADGKIDWVWQNH